ncbi:hypothetical protein GMOD_00006494 [Pyrenophora seminiperda CCB06]|uniref:F-box domain-containing protein n=1 Tax=Pyrenophora seminiperda CCB06 TaxID=1302712 RepID=A0A3M7M563_9PLEO|nr:hypothetical protein GMOD_00006494 [Pyrenophora seminiperda CCB06]
MFQLPSTTIAIGDPRTTIHGLPHETIFKIGAQFAGVNRNRDLANLALVSTAWRTVAQKWLLKEPCFHITNIYKYMWKLGHRSKLLEQVLDDNYEKTSLCIMTLERPPYEGEWDKDGDAVKR